MAKKGLIGPLCYLGCGAFLGENASRINSALCLHTQKYVKIQFAAWMYCKSLACYSEKKAPLFFPVYSQPAILC